MNEQWASPYWLASMQARYPQPVPSQSLPTNNSMMMMNYYYDVTHTNNNNNNNNNTDFNATCRHQVSNRTKRKPKKSQQKQHSRRLSAPHAMPSSSIQDNSLPPLCPLPLKKKPLSSPAQRQYQQQQLQLQQQLQQPRQRKIKRKPVPPVAQLSHAIKDIRLNTTAANGNYLLQQDEDDDDDNDDDDEEEPIMRPSHPLKSLQNQQILLRSPLSVSSTSSSLFELSSPSSASSTSSSYGSHPLPLLRQQKQQHSSKQYNRQSLPLPETVTIFNPPASATKTTITNVSKASSARHQYKPHKLNRIHSARPQESDDDDYDDASFENNYSPEDREETESVQNPTFWNPRPGPDVGAPIRRNLSRKLKGLLQPQKIRMEGVTKDQHTAYRIWSVERPKTPTFFGNDVSDTKLNNESRLLNPFQILSNALPVADALTLDDFHDNEFAHIDTYTANVKQRGPMLTPTLLATKFLARPYRHDLHKVRAIFVWIVQNIIMDNNYHQSAFFEQQHQDQQNEINSNSVITTTTTHTSNSSIMETTNNTSETVLSKRMCSSPLGMANLFCEMANAINLEAQVIYGYLRGHKDTMAADGIPNENHVWCSVKVGGEYRFVDCWLASPYYSTNNNNIEPHWFLCRPSDMIYTHFPTNPVDQYLEPPISISAFFALPYVCLPFFRHHIQIINYDPANCNTLTNDKICHITLQVDHDISCYAEVETRTQLDLTHTQLVKTRGLAQCFTRDDDSTSHNNDRMCKIKAQLPQDQWMGWLKVYAGPRVIPATTSGQQQQEKLDSKHYPLAFSFRLTRQQEPHQQQLQLQQKPFDFVQLHICQYELYIQEPQCYQLYPLQKYNFSVKSNHTHHKLAIRSPNGRLYKLTYYPHDHTYDGTITVSEVGQWTLVCLLHHAGGLYVVASWDCKS